MMTQEWLLGILGGLLIDTGMITILANNLIANLDSLIYYMESLACPRRSIEYAIQ